MKKTLLTMSALLLGGGLSAQMSMKESPPDQFRGRTPPKYGYAAASAIILFLIIFVFTQIQQLVQKKWKY